MSMKINDGEIKSIIRQFVVKYIEKKSKLPLDCNFELFNYIDSGYVDSMGIMMFVANIESEFDIEILEEDMESSEFRIIGGLCLIIERKIVARTL